MERIVVNYLTFSGNFAIPEIETKVKQVILEYNLIGLYEILRMPLSISELKRILENMFVDIIKDMDTRFFYGRAPNSIKQEFLIRLYGHNVNFRGRKLGEYFNVINTGYDNIKEIARKGMDIE